MLNSYVWTSELLLPIDFDIIITINMYIQIKRILVIESKKLFYESKQTVQKKFLKFFTLGKLNPCFSIQESKFSQIYQEYKIYIYNL